MVSLGTFLPTGDVGNSTEVFSEQSFPLEPSYLKDVYLIFIPARDLGTGNYTLMLVSENDAITIMKAIKLHIS
jgi:hypothetical protein